MECAHSRSRSDFTLLSTSMIFEPAKSCMTRPDVTIGLMPSSIHVPLQDNSESKQRTETITLLASLEADIYFPDCG